MKELNTYIIEKLHLNKDTQINSKKSISEKNKTFIESLFDKKDGFDFNKLEKEIRKYRSDNTLISLFVDLTVLSNAKLFKESDTVIRMYPCNFGYDILSKLFYRKSQEENKELIIKILDEYDSKKDNEPSDYISSNLSDFLISKIKAVLKNIGIDSYGLGLKHYDIRNYSRTENNKFKGLYVCPFTLSITKDKVYTLNCEISFDSSGHYYHYIVNGNRSQLSSDFRENINKIIK